MPVIRRTYRQGNSTVISLPEWMLESMGMRKGDSFLLEIGPKRRITLVPWTAMGLRVPRKED